MCTLIVSTGMQGWRLTRCVNYTIKERQGWEIISSVIQNIQIGDMTGATGVTGLEPDSIQVQVWN